MNHPTPTLIKTASQGIVTDPALAVEAMRTILAEAREWGLLGIDLEWDKYDRVTWIGLGTAKRAFAFWRATLPEEALALARAAMADPTLPKLGHNGIQADRPVWERELGPVSGMGTFQDSLLMHHAAYPGLPHDLQQVVSQFLVVPPWKAWRAIAQKKALEEAKAKAKLEKEIAKAKNKERVTVARATIAAERAELRELKKSAKQLEHEQRNADSAAEKLARKAERQAAHDARNAALKAGKAAKKAASKATFAAEVTEAAHVPAAAVLDAAEKLVATTDVMVAAAEQAVQAAACAHTNTKRGPVGVICLDCDMRATLLHDGNLSEWFNV